MEASTRTRTRPVKAPLHGGLRTWILSPLFLMSAGCAAVAIGAGLVAFHVTAFTLDESLIEQSAVHYTSNLPHSLLHDVDARATDRLYSLVLSLAFHLFPAANAIAIDHVLSVILFVSAAAPIYVLAKILLRSDLAAASAAVLSIVVPWLAITSALFTENLSYPLFWWAMLAATRTISQPSRRRDVLTLVCIGLLVCTRVQFAAVFIGYLLALIAVSYWRTPAANSPLRRSAGAVMALSRRCTLTTLLVIGSLAVFAYAQLTGEWTRHVETLLGSYSNVIVNKTIPPNMVEALGVELLALALGVGLLPALISIVWYIKSIATPSRGDRRIILMALGIILAAFLLLTVFSQLGYIGGMTEERYFFYIVPVFWIGTFAAIEDRNIRPGEIVICALAFAFLYGAIPFVTSPFGQEIAFLAPVESISAHVFAQREAAAGLTGLTLQDALALFTVIVGILAASAWKQTPRLRGWLILGAAAIIQLLFTGYAYAVISGHLSGTVGRTTGSVTALGWVDAHAKPGQVSWLDNLSLAAPPAGVAAPTEDQARTTLFWNSHLTSWIALPATGLPVPEWPMNALPNDPSLTVDESTGLIGPTATVAPMHEVVGATNSAFVQVAGSPTAHSPDGVLTLTSLSDPVRATWLTRGLQPDGYIAAGTPAQLSAFVVRSSTPQAVSVRLTLVGPPAATPTTHQMTAVELRFGSIRRLILLRPGQSRRVTAYACLSAGATSTHGALRPLRSAELAGRELAAMLSEVQIMPAEGGATCLR